MKQWLTAPASSELEGIRDSLRSFLDDAGSIPQFRSVLDGAQSVDHAQWKALAALGATQMLVAEAQGGLGLSLRDALAVAQEFGRTLNPQPFVASVIGASVALTGLDRSAPGDKVLARIASGQIVAGLACLSTHADSGHAAAVLDADGRLQGRIDTAMPGPFCDGWLVRATRGDQALLLWLDAGTVGLEVEPVSRVDGTTLSHLVFDDVRVTGEQILGSGEAALRAADDATHATRLGQAAELLGVARGALALTVDYLKTREQFGKPIGSFQALQHKAVDVLVKVELAAASLADAADLAAEDPDRLPAEAARAKARCAQAALQAARFAIQAHGAMGITHECDAGLYLKKALHLASHLGTRRELQRIHFASMSHAQAADDGDASVQLAPDTDLESLSEQDFRTAVRDFAKRHCPPNILHLSRSPSWPEYKPWYQALSRQGWIAPAWPRDHGGLSLAPGRLLAFYEELEGVGVTKGAELGLSMVGPLLINFGTREQQAQYLPGILSGDDVWCQGYSEPGSGSDLASLRTAAVLDGDDYIVTGQKIWTTYAMYATHIFMLVRTARTERKQDGISFLLVNLDTPGIRVRPIKDVGGHEKFCEVFFDQARVPVSALVGSPNKGWDMAKALLGYERLMIGSPKQAIYMLGQLRQLGMELRLFDMDDFVAEFAELQLEVRDLQSLYRGFADIFRQGKPIPPSIAMLKIVATEVYQRLCDRMVEWSGEAGGSWQAQRIGGTDFEPVAQLMMSLPASIYGGSNEIQRNILSKAVLGLPG